MLFTGQACPRRFIVVLMFIWCYLQARRALGDFGIVISIILMVLVDYSIKDIYTQVSYLLQFQHFLNYFLQNTYFVFRMRLYLLLNSMEYIHVLMNTGTMCLITEIGDSRTLCTNIARQKGMVCAPSWYQETNWDLCYICFNYSSCSHIHTLVPWDPDHWVSTQC